MGKKLLSLIIICIFVIFIGYLIFKNVSPHSPSINVSTEYIKINNAPNYVANWINSIKNEHGIHLSKNYNGNEFYLYSNNTKIITLNHTIDNNGELNITTSLEAYEEGRINDTYFKFIVLNHKPKYIIVDNVKFQYNNIEQIN